MRLKTFKEFIKESENKNYDFYNDTTINSIDVKINVDDSYLHGAVDLITNKEVSKLSTKNDIINKMVTKSNQTTNDETLSTDFEKSMYDNSAKMINQMFK